MMTIEEITAKQKSYGVTDTQNGINTGDIWKFEGSVGRFAMEMIENGVCVLSEKVTYDFYGNRLPSRFEVKEGTKGSIQFASDFWEDVDDDMNKMDALYDMFGSPEYEGEQEN